MQERQISLVEAGIGELVGTRGAVAALFCERLFVHDPSLRSIFDRAALTLDGQRLESYLTLFLVGLREPEAVFPTLSALARAYPEHCMDTALHDTFRKAWIETLALVFGPGLTHDIRTAWNEACRYASRMLDSVTHAA